MKKKLIGIILVFTLVAIAFAGCTGEEKEKYSVSSFGIAFVTSYNNLQNNTNLILPSLILPNETVLAIEEIYIDENKYTKIEEIDDYIINFENTKYGIGINITPIPNYIELIFDYYHLEKFAENDLEMVDHFYSNGPGLSFWEENEKSYTFIYSSIELDAECFFSFRRYPDDPAKQAKIVRDFNFLDSLSQNWNSIPLERGLISMLDDD